MFFPDSLFFFRSKCTFWDLFVLDDPSLVTSPLCNDVYDAMRDEFRPFGAWDKEDSNFSVLKHFPHHSPLCSVVAVDD